jgi:hypothetical protein
VQKYAKGKGKKPMADVVEKVMQRNAPTLGTGSTGT